MDRGCRCQDCLSGAALGRTATSRVSTPAFAMSCSTARSSTLCARPRIVIESSTSVVGVLTGRGADLIIIDDPVCTENWIRLDASQSHATIPPTRRHRRSWNRGCIVSRRLTQVRDMGRRHLKTRKWPQRRATVSVSRRNVAQILASGTWPQRPDWLAGVGGLELRNLETLGRGKSSITTGLPLQTERQCRRLTWPLLPRLGSRPAGDSATVGLRW